MFTANKLVGQDGVKFAVSGSYSASGRAAAPIFQTAKVPFISAYGVHPDITRAGDHVFRGVHLGPPQGRAGAKFVGEMLGFKQISVISMDNDYGQATLEGFKSAVDQFGIKILGEYSYSLRDRQFGSIVASVKRDNPQAIYVTGYFFTAGPLVTQIRAAGITVPIIGSQAFDAQKLLEIAGSAVEGVYVVGGLNRDRDNAELKAYLAEFQKRSGYLGENVGATVYSAHRADGRCDQAGGQPRSGQGARRPGGDQELSASRRRAGQLQSAARDQHADERQRGEGRKIPASRLDR